MQHPPVTLLQNKRVVLGVTGSIAAYKAVDLASTLTQAGALVDVILTESAQEFILPLTFQAVTGRPVYTSLWKTESSGSLPTHIAHVGLGEGASLLLIAPATANTIAKLTSGLADDLLSVTALAARCPLVIAPAMDGAMYEHPAVQANLAALRERGVMVIEPDIGRFASGLTGKGRFPSTAVLMGTVRQALGKSGSLANRRVLVTAGGTREAIDPVRYITNRSSGKQGYAIAQAAVDAGAHVTLISTVRDLPLPYGVQSISVVSAAEMLAAVESNLHEIDVLIMAAAVADFRPAAIAVHKIKKTEQDSDLTLTLARTSDILLHVKSVRENTGFPRVAIGFAAESENLLANAQDKLKRKGLDMLVANDILKLGAGFESDTNQITLLFADGRVHPLELTSKALASETIVSHASELVRGQPLIS